MCGRIPEELMNKTSFKPEPSGWALLPVMVFLVLYLAVSLIAGDFYKMPITVAFLISSAVAIAMPGGGNLNKRISRFCGGAADRNIMLMVVIFILAGAFAKTAKEMGAVDAAVNMAVYILPADMLAVGIFIAACFISISVGTSVGTIAALTPVAIGVAAKTGMPEAFMLGVTVSGAMFGDNLSFISDTTIVATRTQGCKMSDKFKVNIRIALPVAVITGLIYFFMSGGTAVMEETGAVEWMKITPYLVVLVTAVMGVNVLLVLFTGIILSGAVGIFTGSFTVWGWTGAINSGIGDMGELIVVTLLAAGILRIVRYNGGIEWITRKMTSRIRTSKGAEGSIAGLVSLANVCTANNTIALIITGPVAKDIAVKYNVDPRRSASILDIFSCTVQGLIPYGAQLLMAAGLSTISPVQIIPYLYYPVLLGVAAVIAIITGYPRKFRVKEPEAIRTDL